MRPIIVVEAAKLLTSKPAPEAPDVMALCIVMFEFVTRYLLKPGVIENTFLIINCKDLSVFNMPYKMIKAVTSTIQTVYKARSRGIFILNAPKTFSIVWKCVKVFLDEVIA